ncbi:MAG TPA: electron transfer flavoprotein subunit beta/FixA family protein [Acidobacteriota bacterium]|nr:electron transfer flavoprotein subunit beta/FixA family protein [Acidobacteriota bacterium]
MRIVVCIKEVSSRESRYEVASDESWIDESNISFEINECDEYALEEALKLKEQFGGEVTLLSVGNPRAEKVMRKALAMGADRGILIVDERRQLTSPHLLGKVMSSALKGEAFDLVLTGTQSDDLSYAQTAVVLAELLSIPHATIVMKIEAEPGSGRLRALREMESGRFQWLELPLPALLSIQAGSSPVRYASLKGIMQAKKKEIRILKPEALGLEATAVPELEVVRLYQKKEERKAELLEGETGAIVEQLVEKLRKEAKVL